MLLFVLAGCGSKSEQPTPQQTQQTEAVTDSAASDQADDAGSGETDDAQGADAQEEASAEAAIDEDGSYTSKEEVALYLHTYEKLPSNFITKKEAKSLGWEGGSLEAYAPGKCIGGDRFGNYEGVLPDGDYHECDIGTLGKSSRGAKRIVYSDDGRIYYTDDHYETFEQLY
ncbi:MAG: ribonuclease [Eubacterium sp.]|nr:ribonuclease [Eubacterium sp.]MBQ9022320.1 ribonuclease [Eubacterium sp.]